MYPLLALLAAGGLSWAIKGVAAQQRWQLGWQARLGLLLTLIALPYWAQCRALARIYDARNNVPSLLYGQHIRRQVQVEPNLREYLAGVDGQFNDSPDFYRAAARLNYNHSITFVTPWSILDKARPGQYVAICGTRTRRNWERLFRTSIMVQSDSCVTLFLEARK